MEEILASIRQIISEDLASVAAGESHAAAEGTAAWDDADDVLILRERAPPEASPFAPPPADHVGAPVESAAEPPIKPPAADPDPVVPDDREWEAGEGRSLALAPSAEPAVMAHETAAVVAASFERLAFVVENTPPPPPFSVSQGGATLEDITREILTPVLKAWLDENLPAIVRARVDEEVERIARGRVR
jgi:cell pole-organizing protein PopZ